jgi:hypothetical protein
MLKQIEIGERIYKFLGYHKVRKGKRFLTDKTKLVLRLINWKELSYHSSEPQDIITTQDHLDKLKSFNSTKIEYIYESETESFKKRSTQKDS